MDIDTIEYDSGDQISYSDSEQLAEPLATSSKMRGALDDIQTGAPGSRTDSSSRDIVAEIRAKMAAAKEKQSELDVRNKAAGAETSKRPRPATSPIGSNKRPMGPKGQTLSEPTNDAMDGDTPASAHVDFGKIMRKVRRIPCAIQVHDEQYVIGHPSSHVSTPGLHIKLRLNPGRLAIPSLALDFSISKTGLDSSNESDYNTFSLVWEPGVEVAGKFMMRDLVFRNDLASEHWPPEIRDAIRAPEEEKRLVRANFWSDAHKASTYNPTWVMDLRGRLAEKASHSLNKLMEGTSGHSMTIWFLFPTMSFPYFYEECLSHLEYAVKHHLQPNHVYRDENGEPQISYKMPSIREVGNEMYVRWQTTKQSDGSKILNKKLPPRFENLPKKSTWDSLRDCHIYYGVATVREQQYNFGVHAPLMRDWHHAYLERMPVFRVDGKSVTSDQTFFRHSYYASIRVTNNAAGAKYVVPPVGSIVKMDFDNGVVGVTQHEVIDDQIWYGRVEERPKTWFTKTGTDFCVLVTKPRRARQRKSWPSDDKIWRPNHELPRVRIQVKVDRAAADRELKALGKFFSANYQPELLDQIRLAIVFDPSRASPAAYGDLTWGPKHAKSQENHDKWTAMMAEFESERRDTPSQMSVLKSASRMERNIVTVSGPAGAGKTRTLRDLLISLLKIKHTVLFVATANVAVDTNATAVWEALTPEERKEFKCLRLEAGGAERAAMLSKVNYAAYQNEDGEEDKLPEYFDEKTVQDSPLVRNPLEKLASDFAARQGQMEEIMDQYASADDVHKALLRDTRLERSNVPGGMTLDYRIWELTEADRVDAVRGYEEARMSQDQFDKSAHYRACVAKYIGLNGKINRMERLEFEDASDQIITRVLAETSVLFTTCTNAAGKLLEDGNSFKPSVIFCDEAGQMSFADLCVPLTTFSDWEGLYKFGDTRRLQPTVLSAMSNEFVENAKMSSFSLLGARGFKGYLLDG